MKYFARSTSRAVSIGALAATLLAPTATLAEDIDLFAGSAGAAAPNVLFFLDNSSNWSASSQAWNKVDVLAKCATNYPVGSRALEDCLGYANEIFGPQTSLVQGQVELRALRLVLGRLVCSNGARLKLNAGTMLLNPNGTADGNSVTAGYVRKHVAPMDPARCADLLNDLSTIDARITQPEFKGPSSAEYGAALYEIFKYFGGYTTPAGAAANQPGAPTGATGFGPVRYSRPIDLEDPQAFVDSARTTYRSPIGSDASCGNNYVILIGNTWPNQEYGTDTGAAPHPTNLLMKRLGYDPGAQIYPRPLQNSDKTDVRFADEWAQFLFNTDVNAAAGQQNLRLLTVDVFNRSADAKQGRLLKSMADSNGTGGYYAVNGDLKTLVDALIDALTKIASVNNVFASASLPVSVNAQGSFLNQIFMGVFRPDANSGQRWAGNLKQYQFALDGDRLYLADADGRSAVDSVNTGFVQNCARSFWTTDSGSYWQTIAGSSASACALSTTSPFSDSPDGPIVERGGAAQRLRSLGHAARNIRTCTDASCSSMVAFSTATLGTLPGLSSTESATLIDWARGRNTGDGSSDSSGQITFTDYGLGSTATRPTVHGEVVHSRPLAVNYGGSSGDDVVVFYGAGDGMLRAINGNKTGSGAGDELWAFVAPEHWSTLNRVRTNSPLVAYPNTPATARPTPQPKAYFFDGQVGGYQERTSSAVNKLYIYPTMRRGGSAVYAFDVTARPGATSQPRFMWKFDAAQSSFMGQSWSTPVAFRIKGLSAPLVAFGAGYDRCEDSEDPNTACSGVSAGRGVFVMDAERGPSAAGLFRHFDPGTTGGRFVADLTPVDVNSDGYVDVLYAVDTRGSIWRINTSDPARGYEGYASVSAWPMQRIATVGLWGASLSERRKFMYAPNAVVLGSQVTLLVGTGDREKPSADSVAAQVLNRFYGIRDDVRITSGITPAVGHGGAPADLYNVTGLSALDPLVLASYRGWFLNLSTAIPPYEQVVTTPLTIGGVTYFNTFQAKTAPDASVCLGTARSYQVDFQTGTSLPGQPLVSTFISQGLPPSPVGGVVSIDGKIVPFLIGGQAPTVLTPTRVTPKVKPNRKPIYRYQRTDG